jgi:hypothetical protein
MNSNTGSTIVRAPRMGDGSPPNPRQPTKAYDRTQAAKDILYASASEIAPVVLPALDMWPDMGVVLNQVSVAANTTSGALNLTFPTDGFCVAVSATTEDGLASAMAGCLLRVQVDGQDDLFSSGSGNGAGFKSFAQISGQFSQGRWCFRRMFLQATAWAVFIQNTTADPVVCDLEFSIVDTRSPPP